MTGPVIRATANNSLRLDGEPAAIGFLSAVITSQIDLGDRGTDVLLAQQSLKEAGYDPGPVDGIYGPMTEAAAQEFQRDRIAAQADLA